MVKTAYGDAALSKTRVYEWFSRFKNKEMSIEDQHRSRRPSTSRSDENVKKINVLVREDRHRTIDQLCEMSGISWSSVQRILSEDLHMRRVAAKFVPRLLTGEQRERRLRACLELQDQLKEDPEFFSKVITGDESWCYGYDPETKQQSSQWMALGSPRPKKARQVKSNLKTLLICFFDCRGVVHAEFVPSGQTVNQQFYLDVLKRLREKISRKRADIWRTGDWFFHHDNAPAHTALSIRQFLTKNGMTPIVHPPYSPDLAPCDFFLFPRLKRDMKGKRFATVEEVKQNSLEGLKSIPESEFKKCFEQWKGRLEKCVVSKGEYFEGDQNLV
nr:unnamed protein product [Callosobruchus analis]